MFVSNGQFYVFIACLAFGGVSGLVFLVFSPIKLLIKNKIVSSLVDFISMLVITILYLVFARNTCLPNFRVYMLIGVLLGLFCYFKSFDFLLAKAQKKFYNIIIKLKGRKRRGRTKEKTSN